MLFKKEKKEAGLKKISRSPGKRFKNKKVIGIICFVLAALLAFVVLPLLYNQQRETGTVLLVSEVVKKGETISAGKIITKEMGTYGLPGGLIADKKAIEGKTAKVDIFPGDFITDAKIGDFVADPIIESYMKAGKELTSVSLASNAAGLAAHLQKGDIVNVACIIETDVGIAIQHYPELQHLEIYDIENANAISVEDIKAGGNADSADAIPKTITFAVTDVQAKRLIEAEYSGKLHVVFVQRGGADE